MAFLVILACATTMTVPVVGALLIFTLMIGPPAAARCFSDRPGLALLGSVGIALATVWAAIACSYEIELAGGLLRRRLQRRMVRHRAWILRLATNPRLAGPTMKGIHYEHASGPLAVPGQEGPRQNTRTHGIEVPADPAGRRIGNPHLRDPRTSRPIAPLGLSVGARWRARLMGPPQGPTRDSVLRPLGRPHRGPSARVRPVLR